MKVNEAFEYLIQEEESRLIDMDQVTRIALDRVESSVKGIRNAVPEPGRTIREPV